MNFAASLKAAKRIVCLLPFAAALAFGQQQVNLAAGPANVTLPDGSSVPMWGYSCTPLASTVTSTATCSALNKAAGTGWSPVLITVPKGQDLQINLTNNLSFTPATAGSTPNTIPTSLVIVGQLGGGLGGTPTRTLSPVHPTQGVTWPTANTGLTFTPPKQPDRVQSFATEVAVGATTALTWTAPRPGTYLLESGTHPSIQGPMGLYGIVVVTDATNGVAYPGVNYDADVPLLMSEIDPVQNAAVDAAVKTSGFSETAVWSGQPNGCGNPSSSTYQTCYPPAVNYTPLYYLFNGVAFDKTNPSASLFAVGNTAIATPTGHTLVRFVNAGLRMHVPSLVGSTAATSTVTGFSLIAEDGNPLPGVPRVQSEVFMAPGKTYDVMIQTPAANAAALPVFDRELSLSGGKIQRDAGMLAYLGTNTSSLPKAASFGGAQATNDTYNAVVPGNTLTISDPAKGVIANDINIFGVKAVTQPTQGTLTLNANGTFSYAASSTWASSDSFVYCGNSAPVPSTLPNPLPSNCATVTLNAATVEGKSGIVMQGVTYNSTMATYFKIGRPGVLSVDTDTAGYPLKANVASITTTGGLNVTMSPDGGFTATAPGPGSYSFTYTAQNSQGTNSGLATVTVNFPIPSNLQVTVLDGKDRTTTITDYRWIIEEDRTIYVDPKNAIHTGNAVVPTLGTNFHTSNMPFVAQGCTGVQSCGGGQTVLNSLSACDIGNGLCRPDPNGTGLTQVLPSQVVLDPSKRYYISVLPGDAANPFYQANAVGHGMGGAPISFGQTAVTILSQPSPYPPGKLSVFVFEDDYPLNGEVDGGGGVDVLAPNEPGLGGFQIHLWDAMGGNGDFTGQMTYDMFNQPLSNSLAGTKDPANGNDACPISAQGGGITGMIVTCPKYESDGKTLSPLAGQAVVANLMPGRWGVVATPSADRIARGEEWLQTNTLDGQKAHDVFTRIGEPSYFQEYGPANYHVTIGFANPAIINGRLADVCAGTDINLPGQGGCNNTITGKVTSQRLSRTPDERLYNSETRDGFAFSQCYVSIGDPDGEDFAFTKCDQDGKFTLTGIPTGSWRITTFDQWNDQLVDGLSTPVFAGGAASGTNVVNVGNIAATQWQTNLFTRTFIDDEKSGVAKASEDGIPFANVAVRLRDGSLENLLVTDFTGTANFNETFPLFSWYTVETDTTRYKNTGTHVVYDAGGPADGTSACGLTGYPPCGGSTIGKYLANTAEQNSVPANLRVPGAVYCAGADCPLKSIQSGPSASDPPSSCTTTNGQVSCSTTLSTGRIDPPWVGVEGWQGFPGQNNFIEFGKEPYAPGENGGIKGHVIYASTRPFDDPQMLVQTQWEPLVPHVTINLYQEGVAADKVTPTLTLVDTTQTSSFDDWAQGFHSDGNGNMIPNMSCPGQTTADLFYFTLQNQPNYLDFYNYQHGGQAMTPLPNSSQYKCYDGMHNWNQIQPAPYDGMYQFPSVTSSDPGTGKPNGTNCKICSANTVVPQTDLYYGLPMLPKGKYVVEVVVPPGYELVKEEDKNILIGDTFIAPVNQQFPGVGTAVFIMPDQAQVASAYNANNAQNATDSLGAQPINGIVPGFVPEPVWPCVGQARVVPDYISLYPQSKQVAPFAGATRNLCDRKEVTLNDQAGAIAKFYIYTSTHIASKFTGGITDDFTSEFDPFSPQYGEKFAPPNLPVAIKDWTGAEINRVYADQWGSYNGMQYSTWEVNPPNPTGYSPTMAIFCMNDAGTGATPDPAFDPGYSQFCYELPFMPGTTQYLDTPVVPTAAFSGGYNHADCAYPNLTPAINEVDGDGKGPWVSAAGNPLTITSLTANGDVPVPNYGYSGPSATQSPFNQQTVTRHYGFGATQGTVTIGGIKAAIQSWSDSSIQVLVPSGVPNCAVQQQTQYGGSAAQCGQLVITTSTGQQSIDTVTVTIGGKPPTVLSSTTPLSPTGVGAIQQAIDNAQPGDLIMIPQGVYREMVIMWKPVRLQGVGAASSIINSDAHPAGKLDPWRARVSCLFGLATNGQPYTTDPSSPNPNPFDPTSTFTCGGWNGFTAAPNSPQVDRLPLEGILGWDTTVNGNLAQLLQEPTLMGAYEGAGILVLSKGVNVPANATGSYYGNGAEATFPVGTLVLTKADCNDTGTNPYPSNFQCNPSSIDGLSVTNSSQGGGGIFVHAWAHNLQIANNRVYNNIGTLSGGINIGQGESPDAYLAGTIADTDPGSCLDQTQYPANTQLPYCFNNNVNLHNNDVTLNTSIGDELFSGTPAGAGGVSICTGADYYKFNYNWVCGNMSTGDGGGFSHLGYIWNGDIEHNTVIFNQSLNPTISTNGGGMIVMGAAPDGFTAAGVECGGTAADADCTPGLPDGTGPGLVINANLIMGNAAESGSGGGLRLQSVNGTEIANFPNGNPSNSKTPGAPTPWNSVQVTNNIIANNVAGWDGAGVSLQDALAVNLINNTIASNDTTASAGVLFNTLGAPLASATGVPQSGQSNGSSSLPQPAGLVAVGNSPQLTSTFGGLNITCPAGHPNCTAVSYPLLANDLFWQNRSFNIGVGAMSAQYQQNVVSLYNAFTTNLAGSQTATGACPTGASYWDIGIRGDSGPGKHDSGFTLAPTYSLLTNTAEAGVGANDVLAANPLLASQYCNGARTPPEAGGFGYQVPPGISDATVPNPIFNLTPSATVDEGNNWVNMTWGPLSLVHPVSKAVLGNYAITVGSAAADVIPSTSPNYALAPATDFFGNPRPDGGNRIDIGAVELQLPQPVITSINVNSGPRGYTTPIVLTGTNLANVTGLSFSRPGIAFSGLVATATSVSANLNIPVTTALGPVTISATTSDNVTSNGITFTVVNPPKATLNSISPSTGGRNSTVPFTISGSSLLTATGLTGLPGGVTLVAGSLSATNDTTLTGSLRISSTAGFGSFNIGVNTIAGASTNTVTFTVVQPPALTSVTPNTGSRGTSVPITLTGVRFTGATALNVSGTGVTVAQNSFQVGSDTQATATLTIAPGASPGSRTLTITGLGGTSNGVSFTVQNPTLTSVSPNSGLTGTSVPVTLTGTGLFGATGLNVAGPNGVTVSNFAVVNSTTVTATLSISTTAPAGFNRNISVQFPNGLTTNSVPFGVTSPTLTSISPASGVYGTSVPVTLTGTNLAGAVSITAGNGITATNIVASANQVSATFVIASNAAAGTRNVMVTTASNGSTPTTNPAVTFTVIHPTLNSISPNSGAPGATVPVTFSGVNLTGATAVNVSGSGVTVSGLAVAANGNSATATLTIALNAMANTRTVSIVTPNGTTNTVNFTVQSPTIANISPNVGTRGTTVAVTINGTNFNQPSLSVRASGTGVTVTNLVVKSPTQITANFVIASGANTGNRNVTVATADGASNSVSFSVQ